MENINSTSGNIRIEIAACCRTRRLFTMFTRKLLTKAFAAGALVALMSPAAIAQTSGNMTVSLTVPKSCSMSVAQNVSFGSQTVTTSTLLSAGGTTGGQRGLVTVTCRAQADTATLTLTSVSESSSSGGTMSNGSSSVGYNLFLPAATGWADANLANCNYGGTLTAWPSDGLDLTVTNSAAKSIAVCAQATIDGNTQAGSYSDTVAVNLSY